MTLPNRPNMTPAMMRQLQQGRGIPSVGTPTQQAAPQSNENFNPLPEGKGGLQVLKSQANCPMSREAATLNALLQKTQETVIEPGHEETLYTAMSEAVALVLRADLECAKSMSTRTAGLFNEEPALKDLSDKAEGLFAKCVALETELKATAEEYNAVSQERWEKSVNAFGLNIQERFYRIDNTKRAIVQVELKCPECTALTKLRDARQKLAAALLAINAETRKEDVKIETPESETPAETK